MARGKSRDGIRALGPGRWEVLVSWREPEGRLRQQSKTVHGTRRDAERVRDELRHRRGSESPAPASESFGAVLNEWIDLRERVLSPSTVEVYLHMIRSRIGPALGHVDVGDLTARQLDRYYLTLSDEGLAARQPAPEFASTAKRLGELAHD